MVKCLGSLRQARRGTCQQGRKDGGAPGYDIIPLASQSRGATPWNQRLETKERRRSSRCHNTILILQQCPFRPTRELRRETPCGGRIRWACPTRLPPTSRLRHRRSIAV